MYPVRSILPISIILTVAYVVKNRRIVDKYRLFARRAINAAAAGMSGSSAEASRPARACLNHKILNICGQ
jgi:hypothetical protein